MEQDDRKHYEKTGREDGFMMSLQCPSCDWIWGDSYACEVEKAVPRCPKCSHEPVLVLKIYAV